MRYLYMEKKIESLKEEIEVLQMEIDLAHSVLDAMGITDKFDLAGRILKLKEKHKNELEKAFEFGCN